MIKYNSNFEYRISKISNEQCSICRSWSKPVSNAMARVYSCSFSYKLVYEIKCDAPIRGHHVYKEIWTPREGGSLYCKKVYCSEMLDIDRHAVGIYKKDRLVGNLPVELSRIILYFLQESETNEVKVVVNGKRRQGLTMVVSSKYCARTEGKPTAKILGDQLKIIK